MSPKDFQPTGSGSPAWLRSWVLPSVLAACALTTLPLLRASSEPLPFPLIERFENFGQEQGLPTAKVHAVLKTTADELWIGTWDGLCRREPDGSFRRFGPEHGLSHRMVSCMAEDRQTGDLWVGTLRGLTRFSAGRMTPYLQTDSGLPNNVVYGIDVADGKVWVATAAGAGSLDVQTGQWKIYDHNNAPMHEPWCYAVKVTPASVFIGVWGGGILEHDPASGRFKEFRDPDRDFHYDLFPDDGPINDITSWVDWEDGVLWQCTYFGFARYDGKNWKTWIQGKSPLISDFTQFVVSHHGVAWIGMDAGVSVTDGVTWVNYLVDDNDQGWREIHRPDQPVERQKTESRLMNRFVLGIHVDDTEAWFATSLGLSRGIFAPPEKPESALLSHVEP